VAAIARAATNTNQEKTPLALSQLIKLGCECLDGSERNIAANLRGRSKKVSAWFMRPTALRPHEWPRTLGISAFVSEVPPRPKKSGNSTTLRTKQRVEFQVASNGMLKLKILRNARPRPAAAFRPRGRRFSSQLPDCCGECIGTFRRHHETSIANDELRIPNIGGDRR
jgi:hypothetical protein